MKRFVKVMFVLQISVLLIAFFAESLPTVIIAGLWTAYDYRLLKSL